MIAEHFGVSLITVRQALRDLEADGLIRKRSAKPAVVAARRSIGQSELEVQELCRHGGLHQGRAAQGEILSQGNFPLCCSAISACARTRPAIACVASCRWESRKRRRSPAISRRISAPSLAAGDFSDVLIFRSLQRHLGLASPWRMYGACRRWPTKPLPRDLGMELRRRRCSTVEMLYQSADQRNVEFSIARHPADLFSITYDAPNDMT